MKLSPYFKELSKSYAYEIEDLTYDSGGANVLRSRLKVKRDQFTDLLPMMEFEPVMVAPAFHKAFSFTNKVLLEKLVVAKSGSFPAWKTVAATLKMEAWADQLAKQALKSEGGEQFMLIAAGLEFILSGIGAADATGDAEPAAAPADVPAEEDERPLDSDDVGEDPGEAGEDYLINQGFDRRSS